MGTVTVPVYRVIASSREIPAVYIIDESVAVVIAAVARHLATVGPHIASKIWVAAVDSRVDDGDDDSVAAGNVPCRRCVHSFEPPELAEPRVIGNVGRAHDVIGL